MSFHERFTSGRVISRLTSDVDTLNELLEAGLDGLLTALLTIVAIMVVLIILDPLLALIAFGSLVPLWFLYRWFSRRATVAFRRTRETVATLIVNIVETFNGIRAVQGFHREARNDELFGRLNDDYREANATAFRLHAVFVPGTSFVGNVAIGAGAARRRLSRHRRQPRPRRADRVHACTCGSSSIRWRTSRSSTTRCSRRRRPWRRSPPCSPNRRPCRSPTSRSRCPSRCAVSVELRGVEFAYRPDRVVLHELDLTIPAGQTVALVGETGAGKSTIAKLIARFYDPIVGRGAARRRRRAIADRAAAAVRGRHDHPGRLPVLRVPSPTTSRSGARPPPATRSIAAAEAVGAHGFIGQLPEGYDTDVRKRGGRLSAGQRQLVAFARAFLADPAVLILDEATSSLDVPTERAVQRALRTVLRDRTALIIAHRLSTVEIADRVLVLADGRVIEDGRPQDLIAAGGGQFAALHESWLDSLVS